MIPEPKWHPLFPLFKKWAMAMDIDVHNHREWRSWWDCYRRGAEDAARTLENIPKETVTE